MINTEKTTNKNRTRIAAEAAIHCPLLDNVNLRGARSILVNITAGPNLGIEEFAEVGEAIGEFASDNALVVIDWICAQPWCSGRVGMIGIS